TNPAYTVVYYADSDWDTANNAPKSGATPLTSSQISYDPTSSQTYYAYAELSSNATYQANYELTGPLAQSFSVGGGKDAVTVSVPTASKVYDGTSFAPTAEAEKDGAPIGLDLVYTYYDSDGTTQLPTAPTNAGSYFVKVAIGPANSADYAISGTSTFAFTIDKAQYDLSGVQWKVGSDTYGLSDNITYVYDGTVRTLSLIGISDVVGGLSVTLGGDYSTKNAGQHTVTLNITQDTQNYEPCALPSTFTWEITKCTVDLSGITWNYDPANPFVFTCDENGPVEFSVAPVLPDGVPDELVTLIESSYGGTYKKMDKGTYRATASIQGTLQSDPDVQNNYTITYPASFAGTLDWKIVEREFDAPVFDGSWSVFDNDVHDLAKTYCLPNDWANYFDIEVKFTLPDGTVVSDYDGHEGDLNKAFNAGTYEITFRVKSGINISADYNVWLGDDDEATVTLEVAPRTITVANWKGMGTKAQPQFADRDVLTDWYDYVIYDADQNPVTPDSDGKLPAGNYTRTIVPTSQNIEIKFAGMEFIAFTVNEDGSEEGVEIIGVDVPVYIGDLTYTGKEVVINEGNVNTYFSGYDRSIMRIVKNVSTLNAGEYTITFALLDPITYVWNGYTGSESEQPEVVANVAARLSVVVPLAANSSEADVDFNVKKAQLSGVWGEKNGIPYLQVPAQYNGLVEFEYSYIDESGNSVAKKDLVKGNPYTVHVTLGEQYTNNFEFVDDEGNILPSDAPMGSPFEYTPAEGFLQQYWQVIVSGVCILLSIIFIILIAVFDSQRRKANKEAKQYTANNNVVGRKQYRTAAVAGVGLFGLAYATWTIIACVLIGVAVVLAIGVIIAKCRSNKAKAALEEAKQAYEVNEIALAEQEEKEEAARLKKEQEEEAKRQKEEEREEEKRRREEERDEEKRRKEEEREEEKRRREEQREEDRRRREEEREDERRRREDERRIAAMSNNNMGMGMGMNPAMGYGAMPPFAMQYAQPPVVQQQPQPMQVVQPAQQVVASTDESKLEKAVEKLATELGHQKRVEGFLDMISQSREKDRVA
ncbi:MAG: hypothetical protein K2K12_05235, partial [Clostridia bacterium]|nr:hypothetical protein [Clostridia bacterium]